MPCLYGLWRFANAYCYIEIKGVGMKKEKQLFFCKVCGYETGKWLGQCPGCKEWNTFVEQPAQKREKRTYGIASFEQLNKPTKLSEIVSEEASRIQTRLEEFNRVLGGGIVKGSLVLVGGDPGIGKSTLLLQVCKDLADQKQTVVYVSGEESLHQIKMRANRLGNVADDLYLYSETNMNQILQVMQEMRPAILVIDSIQTMYREEIDAAPGSMSQVREITAMLLRLAKGFGIRVFIIGHVTKEGMVAGPRVLEHMVDTVLYFEGEQQGMHRILRAVKNRFGSTNEIGVFQMEQTGLVEVQNPSQALLQGKPEGEAGSVIACVMEGTRPILVEIQALVCRTNFNMPRRTAVGIDYNRMNLLMAVIEKRLRIAMGGCDAYINVAGGLRLNEPALDLAIVLALISSYQNRPIKRKMIVFGEVGLTGEVRMVRQEKQRLMEAEKMGFEICLLPKSEKQLLQSKKIKVVAISHIRELFEAENTVFL